VRAVRRPASWPLAVKMTMAMVATALAPMFVTAVYNLNSTQAHVADVEMRNLEQLAQTTAGRISQLIGDTQALADYVGTDDDFVAYMSKPNPEGTKQTLSKLQGLIKANPDLQFAMVMDPAGNAIVATDPDVMGKNFKFREYFKVAMEGKSFMTGITVGAVAGKAGVFYSRPGVRELRQQDRDRRRWCCGIKAEPIARILAAAMVGDDRIPFLVDDDGVIVLAPEREIHVSQPRAARQGDAGGDRRRPALPPQDHRVDPPARSSPRRWSGGKQRGHVSYTSNMTGTREIAGYAPVPGTTGWSRVGSRATTSPRPLDRLVPEGRC
jgi:hypothetical protein